jgi:hypothetical protein
VKGADRNVQVDWDVFLQNDAAVDALIEFIEGRKNNRQLSAACRNAACRQEVDRMRVLGNFESRRQAEKFLRQYYTWE